MSLTAACSSFSLRLQIMTSAPAVAKIIAIALPMPLLPPVTSALLPLKSNMFALTLC
jgi:hypothetical protein